MIELKYASKRFKDMNDLELLVSASGLLLKISYITGWLLPTTNEHMDVLEDQFKKKLTESYQNLNVEEIEYAVRNSHIKDWGKLLNLNLIDEAVGPYLVRRMQASMVEEQKLPALEEKKDVSSQTYTEWYDDVKRRFLSGDMTVDFIPVQLYDWMVKGGRINLSNGEKNEFLKQAAEYRYRFLVNNSFTKQEMEYLNKYVGMMSTGVFEGQEVGILKNLAKKLALIKTF